MDALFPRMPLPQGLAYKFLGTFARCEYALKSSGFAKGGSGSVEANWDLFANSIDLNFRELTDQPFKHAVSYILAEPPRKQVLRDGCVQWQDSPPDLNLPTVQQTLLMVRRVRNNLFHGAKVWSPEYDNRDRDIRLVEASVLILENIVRLNPDVNRAYNIGAF